MNAFTAVSLEPALCQVTLTRQSKACGYLQGTPFAVNVLAAVAAQRARDEGGPRLPAQVLIYPVVDPTAQLPSRQGAPRGPHRRAVGRGRELHDAIVAFLTKRLAARARPAVER